ncbi:MAG: S8 family peptidase [Butyribacter sp.]|nr:S8 family peptidase [bacterium]MDY3853684.1 S8 family peptidase [Butyribacter sp.]
MNRVSEIIHLNYARQRNLTGKGIGVAIFDTGVGYHPDLFSASSSGLVEFIDTLHGKKQYYDDNGHGTHIAGILAGSGKTCHGLFQGIAPGCHYVMIKVLNQRGEGNTENVLAGIDWLLQHYREYHIRIVNISVGSIRGKKIDESSPLVQGVNRLWSAGLTVFTAAGNHGPLPSSIGAPGISRKIITVGSSDITRNHTEKDYSGRGPTSNCIKKPDIVAPGSHIVSCYPMNPYDKRHLPLLLSAKDTPLIYNNAAYLARTGTSMSTPVISGCAALLLEKHPELTNKEVKLHLRNTALNLGFSHARQGWGLIQCNRLLS